MIQRTRTFIMHPGNPFYLRFFFNFQHCRNSFLYFPFQIIRLPMNCKLQWCLVHPWVDPLTLPATVTTKVCFNLNRHWHPPNTVFPLMIKRISMISLTVCHFEIIIIPFMLSKILRVKKYCVVPKKSTAKSKITPQKMYPNSLSTKYVFSYRKSLANPY